MRKPLHHHQCGSLDFEQL